MSNPKMTKHNQMDVVPKQFVRDMIECDEARRKCIAKELHGSVQSKLSACLLLLSGYEQTLKEENNRDALTDVIDRVRDVMEGLVRQEVDQLIANLYPPLLNIGLLPAMKLLMKKKKDLGKDGSSVPVDLSVDERFRIWDLTAEHPSIETVRLELYRFIESILRQRGVKSVRLGSDPEEAHVSVIVKMDTVEWTGSDGKAPSFEWFAKRLCIMGGEVRFNHSSQDRFATLTAVMPVSIANQQ